MKNKQDRYEWALDYISYGIRKGFINESFDIEEKTPDEIIEFAERLDAQGEAAYEAWKEDH